MSQKRKFQMVFGFSVLLCIGGVIFAVYTKVEDGGRGGALAVALALFIFFLDRDYATQIYMIVTEEARSLREQHEALSADRDRTETGDAYRSEQLDKLRNQIEALAARIDVAAKSQKQQNAYLAWATLIGTLTWGFGDLVARYAASLALASRCHGR